MDLMLPGRLLVYLSSCINIFKTTSNKMHFRESRRGDGENLSFLTHTEMEVWAVHSGSFPQNNLIQISYWWEIACFLPLKGILPFSLHIPHLRLEALSLHIHSNAEICKSRRVNLQRQRVKLRRTAWKELIKNCDSHTRRRSQLAPEFR